MNLLKKVVLLLALCLSVGFLNAQQDPQFTQYMYNTMTVNPAYAGSQGHLAATFLARTQWLGFEGAPNTQTLSLDTPLRWRGVGLGVNAINDQVGPANEIYIDANISYAIETSQTGRLAFGLKLGSRILNVDQNDFNNKNKTNLEGVSTAFATVGAGLLYYTDKYYLGVSVPNMLPTDHYNEITNKVSAERFHFFTIAGYVFDLSENIKFKPATLVRLVTGAPTSIDVSANFLFNQKFNAGISWRWDSSISAMIGFYASDKFHIGYAYDMTTTDFRKTNDGSHELVLRYNFLKTKDKNAISVNSFRFF